MLMEKERQMLVEYGIKMVEEKLTRGTGGNLSIIDRDQGLVVITPSGLGYYEVTAEDIVVLDLNGTVVEGKRKPSSEFQMHLSYYNSRKDVNAVVHTHPIYCVTLSALRWDLPAVDYLVAISGATSVKCAKYSSFGSADLAKNAVEATGESNAVLLANHGLNTIGSSMASAFEVSVILEMMAEVYLRAKSVGTPVILDESEMTFMLEKFKTYGQ